VKAEGSASGQDCLVIGGGVIGLGVAWELSRLGLGVTLVERHHRCGRATSAAAAGMLAAGVEAGSPGPFFELCRASSELWKGWADSLQEASSVDCEYDRCGLVRVTCSAERLPVLEARRDWQRSQGIAVSETLSPERLREEAPGMSSDVVAGLLYPSEGQVHSHRVVEALEVACRRAGVQVKTSFEVAGLSVQGDRPVVIGTDGGRLHADHVVVAAGPWSGSWLAPLGVSVVVEPVRGQIAAIVQPPASIPRIVFGDHGYIVQKRSGLTLVGATEEKVGFSSWQTLAALSQLSQVAQELLPGVASAPFSHSWAGLRPYAHGGPLLGRTPATKRVLLATGHYRNGILLAPVTAKLMARAVVEGEDPPELMPFSPGRVA